MTRLTYVPRPPLSHLIEFLWAYDAYGAGHSRERVLPGPASELVVVLRGGRPGAVFCGAQSESFIIETADRPALLGVHFKPGGAFPFLRRMPADELHNLRVSLDAIWGADARELHERLQEVGLTPKLYCRVRRFQEVLVLIERANDIDWTDVALACGYYDDQAHFIHDFRAFAGINPTAYVRAGVRDRGHIPLAE